MAKETAKPTKKPAKKAAPRKARKPADFVPRATVRMYCQGLGDCFLLSFETAPKVFFRVLIDCGIYKASPDAGRIMNEVVDDIVETTKTDEHEHGYVDVLVVTHEHWDHISGFYQAIDKFELLDVGEVWQAWTEDEKDPIARDLLAKYKKVKANLVGALRALQNAKGLSVPRALGEAFEVMGFFGVSKEGGKDGDKANDDEYEMIKKMLARKGRPDCLVPGEVKELEGTGVKAFVLGPPKDLVALGKDDPGAKDGYHKQASAFFDGMGAALGAIESGADAVDAADRRGKPFAPRQEVPLAHAKETDFYRHLYAFGDGDHPQAFRSIDDIESESLGHLALRLDSHINNTSLVLAFRLESGRVLLFPGDAQAGNWKSWANPEKPLAFENPKIDARELLEQTVFYKVGHHGSHNATPKTYGLALMTHPGLRAMVPVDHEIAFGAGYGEMPLIEILNDLGKRTGGSSVRADKLAEAPAATFTLSTKMLSLRTKKGGSTFERPLYCETSYDLDD